MTKSKASGQISASWPETFRHLMLPSTYGTASQVDATLLPGRRSLTNSAMTPASRSAQSPGRKGLPPDVVPMILRSALSRPVLGL